MFLFSMFDREACQDHQLDQYCLLLSGKGEEYKQINISVRNFVII